jgi:phosphatidate cytidylyltransferase
MHSKRIITGFILGLLAIWSIFWWPNYEFSILCALLISWAALEWISFVKLTRWWHQALGLIGLWALMFIGFRYDIVTYYIAVIWWITALVIVLLPFEKSVWLKKPAYSLIVGLITLVPTWVAVVNLHQQSPTILFYLIMLVCFGDTGAYFIGTKWGKHKLFPILSPKKSVEGLIGGMLIGSIAGMGVVAFIHKLSPMDYVLWFVLGVFLILVSVLGDVFESLVKRQCEVKDSGNILPGHGGMLDRIDSLTATLPIFALACILLGYIQ